VATPSAGSATFKSPTCDPRLGIPSDISIAPPPQTSQHHLFSTHLDNERWAFDDEYRLWRIPADSDPIEMNTIFSLEDSTLSDLSTSRGNYRYDVDFTPN
jgi:hypothetical protein